MGLSFPAHSLMVSRILRIISSCYERPGLPEELQFSDPPRANETGIVYKAPGDLNSESQLLIDGGSMSGTPMDECIDRCVRACVRGCLHQISIVPSPYHLHRVLVCIRAVCSLSPISHVSQYHRSASV